MVDVLLGPWSLPVSVVVFVVAGAVTAVGAYRMAGLGDVLADRTGWGEAIFGALFFGAMTSLSGIVITAVTAATDSPTLAYSNAIGGITAQTAAIAVADLFYRRGNLEHAAASLSNILFAALLIGLLLVVAMASLLPPVTVLGVHPASVLVVLLYVGGLLLIRRSSEEPMWTAVRAGGVAPQDESAEEADTDPRRSGAIWGEFVAIGLVVGLGGAALAIAAEGIVVATGLSAGFVGVVLLGIVNALPEAVTAAAAVRRGAYTLAIAAIIGGNCFDALNVAIGDVAYRGGSLYHAAGPDELFTTLASALMTVIVLLGLIVRQQRGPGRVGFEGVALGVTYLAIVGVLAS